MNQISILRFFRKLYSKSIGTYQFPPLPCERNIDKASDVIYNLLDTGKPCMIARFGATELSTIVNYLGVQSLNGVLFKEKLQNGGGIRKYSNKWRFGQAFFPLHRIQFLVFAD